MRSPDHGGILRFSGLRREVRIRADGVALDHLRMNFAAMTVAGEGERQLDYEVSGDDAAGWRLRRNGTAIALADPADGDPLVLRTLGELTHVIESDLIVQLQFLRPDLLFVHAAALELDGAVHLVTGPSGAGKSTTCWGLLHEGFRYLSDEIAPIDIVTFAVSAYPHALCMKRDPPASHPVPEPVRRTSRGLHIPIDEDRLASTEPPRILRSIFFVDHDPDRAHPFVYPVGRAEAAARIYPNILNALAHDNDGLAAAAALAANVHAFRLQAADLSATCRLVRDTLERITS
jgi:hypothetical protein